MTKAGGWGHACDATKQGGQPTKPSSIPSMSHHQKTQEGKKAHDGGTVCLKSELR